MRLLAMVAALALCAGLAACSSTAASTPSTTIPMSPAAATVKFPATSTTVAGIVDATISRIKAAEGSNDPNVYENAGASARFAGSQLNSLTYPTGARAQADALIAILRATSVDSAMAAEPAGADFTVLRQAFAGDANKVAAACQLLIHTLGNTPANR